jgi:pimeloyl-ACP methyl ester carboxylesterase
VTRADGTRRSRRRSLLPLGLALAAASACGGDGAQAPDAEEPAAPGCRDAALPSAALYRVCFPQSWNGDLVVYAHGYVAGSEPLALPDDQLGGQSISAVVNGLGYAYATTSYRANGLVADLAVDDVVELADEVRRRFQPDPSRVFVVGVSEGGLVAALAAERRPAVVSGALAGCGPIGDFTAQVDYYGDFRVVFDYFFPSVIPGDPMDVPDSVRSKWNTTYAPAVRAALDADPGAALELLTVTGAPHAAADLSATAATVLDALWYDVFALPDAKERLGGQPYDNIGRAYHGSADDAALNGGVARVSADAGARAGLGAFETTGELAAPLVALHTTRDPIVPATQSERYGEKVAAAGAGALLEQRAVDRYGHCAFQPGELLDAFAAMIQRASAAARID